MELIPVTKGSSYVYEYAKWHNRTQIGRNASYERHFLNDFVVSTDENKTDVPYDFLFRNRYEEYTALILQKMSPVSNASKVI